MKHAESLEENFHKLCAADPVFQIENVQGCMTMHSFQKQLLWDLQKYNRVACRAAHGLGKTFAASRKVLAFTPTFPGAKVITTAPTGRLVKKLLWSEINAGFKQSKMPLGGRMLTTEWNIRPDWFAVGYSPQKEAGTFDGGQGTASTFQGFHSKNMLIVFDEATGIVKQVWIQVEGMLTSQFFEFLAIGNPTSKASEFFKCFGNPLWKNVHWPCFVSPNLECMKIKSEEHVQEELIRLRNMDILERLKRLKGYKVVDPHLVTFRWVMERAIEWGMNHPLFRSKVIAEFPETDEHVILPLGAVERAQIREVHPFPEDKHTLGVDCARYGPDKSVLTHMHGTKILPLNRYPKNDTNELTGEIIKIIREIGRVDTVVSIDATGLGAGVYDNVQLAWEENRIPQCEIREVHFAGSPTFQSETKQYTNLKAQIFMQLGDDIEDLDLPDNITEYTEQLPLIRYKFDSKNRYQIESKDDFKKRTGMPSPDEADSLALANYGRCDVQASGTFEPPPQEAFRQSISGINTSGESW